MVRPKPKPVENSDALQGTLKNLILFNDDVNTFEFVIESLVEVCDHDFEQAEQCALITHLKGKCSIKTGTDSSLNPMREELTQRGLTVELSR